MIPANWLVIVLAERGPYARQFYPEIVRLGWHPFLRINACGKYRPAGASEFRRLATLLRQVGSAWSGRVTCFKLNPRVCTLLTRWEEGHTEAWLIVTDLAAKQADAFCYAMRPWLECSLKDTRPSGWQWQQTHISGSQRAARHWMAIAVATLWVVSVSGEADATLPASSFDELPPSPVACRPTRRGFKPRLLSCF